MPYITLERDFFIGKEYWQYKAQVEVRNDEVYDTTIIWAKGFDEDDRLLDLTEFIEDIIKERAESEAQDQIGDVFSEYNTCGIHDEEEGE